MTVTDRLNEVNTRIASACTRAGRKRDEVTLIAVSKTHPAEAVREALLAGQTVFGENRVQELRDKTDRLWELFRREEAPSMRQDIPGTGYCALPDTGIAWHLIGTLQTNKVKYLPAIPQLTMIHSVDSIRLAHEIERRYAHMDVLIEVNMAQEESKAGLAPEDVRALLEEIAPLSHLRVRGLMTIAPFTEEAESNRIHFRGLRNLMQTMNDAAILPAPMTELSMGMSGDYEVAIEEGATLIRVGTAIFGDRAYMTGR